MSSQINQHCLRNKQVCTKGAQIQSQGQLTLEMLELCRLCTQFPHVCIMVLTSDSPGKGQSATDSEIRIREGAKWERQAALPPIFLACLLLLWRSVCCCGQDKRWAGQGRVVGKLWCEISVLLRLTRHQMFKHRRESLSVAGGLPSHDPWQAPNTGGRMRCVVWPGVPGVVC